MSFSSKYQAWIAECQTIVDNATRDESNKIFRKRIAAIAVLHKYTRLLEKRRYRRKRFWIHPLFKLRTLHGFYEAIFPTLSSYPDKFENYFRISTTEFEELFCLVGPIISKQYAIRAPIPAAARLALTLRYLATGDCMTSISYQYLIGSTTVCNIIKETCKAIWSSLSETVLPHPLQRVDWYRIAEDFENQWQFNHCIGAIDGKHVLIECPDNAGSAFFNYKNSHSIVLLAICDANYIFTFVDIGAYGRRSDGGIFRDSLMGQKFNQGKMNVPESEKLTVDGIPLPYVLVGDEAFQLTNYLLRPYPGRGLSQDQRTFNYRLSRARRVVENAFAILVSQWRVLKKPIETHVDNTIKSVQAIICLHNWLRKRDDEGEYVTPGIIDRHDLDGFIPGRWREDIVNSAFRSIHTRGINNSSRVAAAIRDEFCDYFVGEGASCSLAVQSLTNCR